MNSFNKNHRNRPRKDLSVFITDGSETSFCDIFGREKSADYETVASEIKKCKRKTDLFVPPLKSSEYVEHSEEPGVLANLIPQIKLSQFTGCLIATNQVFFSRAGILLYEGNCVGAVYSNNFGKTIEQSDVALRLSLKEAYESGSQITTYDLPMNLVVPYSALFFGGPMKVDEVSRGKRYLSFLMDCMQESKSTGTLVVYQVETSNLCFIHYLDGVFGGYFQLYEKELIQDLGSLMSYLEGITVAKVTASILSNQIGNKSASFGLCLEEHMPGAVR